MTAPTTFAPAETGLPPSRFDFSWDARDRSSRARSGQALTFARTGAASSRDSAGRLVRPIDAIPRYHMSPNASSAFDEMGLLIEAVRTNLAIQSQDFNTTWTKTNVTVSTNVLRAPDGTLTADRIVETAVNNVHHLSETYTIGAGNYVTWSVWVRAAERARLQLVVSNGADSISALLRVDALTKATAVGGAGIISDSGIESWGDSWYRVWVSGRVNAGSTSVTAYLQLINASDAGSYLGVVTSGLGLWGAQFESDRHLTSYIPTTTTSVARSRDSLTAVPSWSFGDDLTVYAKYLRPPFVGSTALANSAALVAIGNAKPRFALYIPDSTPANLSAYVDDAAAGTSGVSVAAPATPVIEVAVNLRKLTTAPEIRIDVGAGPSAYSGGAAAVADWGAALLQIGDLGFALGNAGLAIQQIRVIRANWTMAQMRAGY